MFSLRRSYSNKASNVIEHRTLMFELGKETGFSLGDEASDTAGSSTTDLFITPPGRQRDRTRCHRPRPVGDPGLD